MRIFKKTNRRRGPGGPVKIGRPARALLCLGLCAALLLAGCGGGDEEASRSLPELSINTSRPAQSAAPSSSQPSSVEESSSLAEGEDPFDPYEAPVLPAGPYTNVGEGDYGTLSGVWHYYANPGTGGLDKPTYQIKFNESPGYLMISFGQLDTGGGNFFGGAYAFYPDGLIMATVQELSMDILEDAEGTSFNMVFKAEWSTEGTDILIVTLQSYDGAPAAFTNDFSSLRTYSLPFVRYDG